MDNVFTAEKPSYSRILEFCLKYGVYTIFLILVVIFSLSNDKFLTVNNFLMLLQQAAPRGIAVIGVTFVLIVAGIDISIGRNMYLSAIIVALIYEKLIAGGMFGSAFSFLLLYLVAIGMGFALGLTNGILSAKFGIVPFIVTLAVGNIARGLGLIASNSRFLPLEGLGAVSNGNIMGVPYVLLIFIVFLVIFDYVLRRTPYGIQIMAIGNDAVAAQKAGINVGKCKLIAFVICGTLAGFGGVLSAGQVGSVAFSFAEGNEFEVISAAVLGGTSLFGGKGSIFPGAIIGIMLIYTIMNGMAMMNASPYAYTIFRGAIIFIAVMVDSVRYKGELR